MADYPNHPKAPVQIEDRSHYPEHDCTNHLSESADDPALPPHITPYECDVCGQWFEHDDQTNELEVDN